LAGLVVGAYVDGDVSSDTTSVTTLTGVTWPTHTGDHLALLAHAYGDGTNTGTMDAAFTNAADLTDTNLRAVLGKRIPSVMTGSESGDVSLTTTTGARQAGALGIWSGYSDVQQVVNQPETSGTAQTTHASPAITPQVAGSGFVIVYMDRVSSGNTTVTPPAGFTKRLEFGTSGSGGVFLCVADDLSGTHGLTPFTPDSWTVAVGSTSALVYLLELTPVAAPTATTEVVSRNPFQIEVFNAAYQKLGEVGAYRACEFVLRHNDIGSWKITLTPDQGGNNTLPYPGRRIRVMYRGVQILSGPVDGWMRIRNGQERYTEVWGFDDLYWLSKRVAYAEPGATFPSPGTVFTQASYADYRSGVAETMIKGWVSANAVTRLAVPGLSVATDQARGSTGKAYGPRFESVFEAAQRIANVSGLGLSVKQTGAGLVFDVYAPVAQPVRLSERLQNLESWQYTVQAPTMSRAVMGGQGEALARKFLQKTLSSSETDWGIREEFHDARDVELDADLVKRADEDLATAAPTAGFSVVPRDSQAMAFATHYNLGDTVTIEDEQGVLMTDVIREVRLMHDQSGRVTVTPVTGSAEASDKSTAIYRLVRRLDKRLNRFLGST